ncbi:unnamed protein product [Oreochromis niloticus]|nr:unnamed protein product [Mustela putorius furo]
MFTLREFNIQREQYSERLYSSEGFSSIVMDAKMDDKVSSVSSSKRTSSSKHSVASTAAKARAIAEAARTRATFAQRELEIKKQKAKLDLEKATLEADLEALELEKAAAVAVAEAEVLEAAAGIDCDDIHSNRSGISPLSIKQQTEAYLEDQARISFKPAIDSQATLSPIYVKKASLSTKQELPESNVEYHTLSTNPGYSQLSEHQPTTGQQPFSPQFTPLSPRYFCKASSERSPHIQHSDTSQRISIQQNSQTPSTGMLDFAKYLARRELVTAGLTKFDDQPEGYRAWQSSFVSTIQDLELTASEELDLLVKWLGKESSEHVKRIRAAHITNPEAALNLSWLRLQECYATPEVIECALFKRLDCFPRLTLRENIKLRELSDLLMELLAAKEDGYLPGLSYLDTPRGINPIVEKLPVNLQEKWLSAGSRYKEQHRVCFPPFAFFVDFVNSEAKARNDPSFVLTNSSRYYNRNEKPMANHDGGRTAIAV